MHYKRINTVDDPSARLGLKLYETAFPYHEQREQPSQARIMTDPEYHFTVIEDHDQPIGLVLYWETATFIYVEHFFIFPECRGQRYGSRVLDDLGTMGKTVILEIDPPTTEIAKRRQGFYERNGYFANPYSHVHPAYHPGFKGHDLVVMSLGKGLSETDYAAFKTYLDEHVMKDVF